MSTSGLPIIALFNYGGGMRGLIPAHFMAQIEQVTGLHMADLVDVFCGPSTGAILNAALTLRHPDEPSRPKYKARHMVRFYEREGIRIFPPDRFRALRGLIHDFNNRTMKISQLNAIFRHGHYNPAHLGRALRALYGDARLENSLKSLVISTYNIDGDQLRLVEEAGETDDAPVHTKNNFIDEGGHAVWIKNILSDSGLIRRHPPLDVGLYDAVMASAAAPTFFPCHHFEAGDPGIKRKISFSSIDGSIFDNPCVNYHGALHQHLPPDRKLIMIVLGTGYINRSIRKEDWNRYGSLGVVDPVNEFPLINIFFHASESALLDGFREEMGGNLRIFNKSLITGRQPDWPNIQLDDASLENVEKLRNFFHIIMEENAKAFDDLCHLLVSARDRRLAERADTPIERWKRRLFAFKRP